jgi:hypothetical protein
MPKNRKPEENLPIFQPDTTCADQAELDWGSLLKCGIAQLFGPSLAKGLI